MDTANINFFDSILSKFRSNKAIRYLKREDVLLDVGCGVQHYFIGNVKRIVSLAIGLDYDITKDVEYENVKLLKGDIFTQYKLLRKYKFTKITMLAVLEHIDPIVVKPTLLSLRSLMKESGFLIMTVPTPKSKLVLETLAKFGVITKKEIFDHKKYYDFEDILDIEKIVGFRLISYRKFQLGFNSLVVFQK